MSARDAVCWPIHPVLADSYVRRPSRPRQRRHPVVMMQPPEHRSSADGPSSRAASTRRLGEARRPLLPDALMRSSAVVEVPILVQHPLEVALTEDDDVVRAFPTERADQSLDVRVRFRRAYGRAGHASPRAPRDVVVERRRELHVVIAAQDLRPLAEGRRLRSCWASQAARHREQEPAGLEVLDQEIPSSVRRWGFRSACHRLGPGARLTVPTTRTAPGGSTGRDCSRGPSRATGLCAPVVTPRDLDACLVDACACSNACSVVISGVVWCCLVTRKYR